MTTHPLTGRYIAGLLPLLFLFIFLALSTLTPTPATAACTDPAREEGAFVYNHSWGVFQGCTPEGWVRFNAPTVTVPSEGCENIIGSVCTGPHAGMIYAGDYNGYKLYAVAEDLPSPLTWGPNPGTTSMGFCDTDPYAAPSCGDGLANTQTLSGDMAFSYPAADQCASLSAHGYDAGQLYLPSRNELNVVYQNLYQGQPAGTHGFNGTYYWSSSEHTENYSWYLSIADDGLFSHNKAHGYSVRCIARETS